MKRKKVNFVKYQIETYEKVKYMIDPIKEPIDIYMFYPNGEWDEWKLTKEEAEEIYPQKEWKWVDVTDKWTEGN